MLYKRFVMCENKEDTADMLGNMQLSYEIQQNKNT